MLRPRASVLQFGLFVVAALAASSVRGDDPPANSNVGGIPARFVQVEEPINSETTKRIRDGVEAFVREVEARPVPKDAKRPVPIVVFEIRPGKSEPGSTPLGGAEDLVRYILEEIDHTRVRTVGFVPESLAGYAVLPVLACDEVAMASDATLGPITPKDRPVDEGVKVRLRSIADKNGREAQLGLFLGMLDPSLDVRRVKTADNQVRYMSATEVDAFRGKAEHAVVEETPVWEAGNRGILTYEMGRGSFIKKQAATRGDVRTAYELDSTADIETGDAEASEMVIAGPVTPAVADRVDRFLRAKMADVSEGEHKSKKIFIRVSSRGGDPNAINRIVKSLLALKDAETIGYIEDEALGLAAQIPLACNKIVFKQGATLGQDSRNEAGGRGNDLDPQVAGDAAADSASARGHSAALARRLFDSRFDLARARDNQANAVVLVLQTPDLPAERFTIQDTIRKAGVPLTLKSDEALALGLASHVVAGDRELWSAFHLKSAPNSEKTTWVDNLVRTLTDPWMSGLLLFVGLFMLILELKLPGVGLPAIISALAFLLFFWSHYLGGTADQLEILLFLVGVVCLALELFVFPGFAVFGLSGILLILASVIMASHTFVWPTNQYEYNQMGGTLMEVTGSIVLVTIGAVLVGRYLPSLPLFRRMILVPVPAGGQIDEATGKPMPDTEATYYYLLGEIGTTTTALKPTGKARFGEALVDVTADGFYIEPGAAIEVFEVQGAKVIVKRA
jgi:membrane-bound serine protease (ClpP class)